MDSVDIAAAIENGRPRAVSEAQERSRKPRLRHLQDLWLAYSFQIVVVAISVVLLIYTIVGKWKRTDQMALKKILKSICIISCTNSLIVTAFK